MKQGSKEIHPDHLGSFLFLWAGPTPGGWCRRRGWQRPAPGPQDLFPCQREILAAGPLGFPVCIPRGVARDN